MVVLHWFARSLKSPALKGDNEDQNIGIAAALRAMEGPLRQIVGNAGDEASVVSTKCVKVKVTTVTTLLLVSMAI